ncbi:hypothetical protein ACFFNY_25560 [Paenibacillus hodogayensis]|uniref:DUF2334 domain-containing protein n=1 Tax=Paenibacillus hodogayensis TaxID=279208 RepID=A0ABV5W3K8_9BACL
MLLQAHIPMAVQVVIDDVGWWSGTDDHATGGPYRTGMARDHTIEDYAAIIELGRRLSIRPQAAMILGEWDRTNMLRRIPSATWQGGAWDNRRWTGPWLEETAELLRQHRGQVELTLHGLCHEYWDNGIPTRAEWFDSNGQMRPESEVRAHLEACAAIWEQNGLGPLPESFVPPAYRYRFQDKDGFADILAEYGIRYLTTVFERSAPSCSRLVSPWFGFDGPLLAVEWRAAMGNEASGVLPWYEADPTLAATRAIEGPVLGLHWPNLLHPDPARNGEVIDRWVAYLKPFELRPDRMLARNTAEGYAQLLYHWGTDLSTEAEAVRFDFSRLDSWNRQLPSFFTLKIVAERPPCLESPDGSLLVAAQPVSPSASCHVFRIERLADSAGTMASKATLTVRSS